MTVADEVALTPTQPTNHTLKTSLKPTLIIRVRISFFINLQIFASAFFSYLQNRIGLAFFVKKVFETRVLYEVFRSKREKKAKVKYLLILPKNPES